MPSGPDWLHEKWSNWGPYDGADKNAVAYLESRGYRLTKGWTWIAPFNLKYDTMSQDDYDAISYLVWEWDFGGLYE